MIEPRWYQSGAVDAVYKALRERKQENPCIVLPTGAGKTYVIAQIVKDCITRWNGRVLVLAHVKELLAQACQSISTLCPEVGVGLYSAGLGSRDTQDQCIIAGIQSVFKRAGELGRFDIVIVDEAHLIPPDGEGMYRQFLAESLAITPHQRVLGLTATPYRMTSGLICDPENILHHICYEASVRELIADGFLCSLIGKRGADASRPDLANVHKRGGEFIPAEMESAFNGDAEKVEAAVRECIEYANATGRQSCLLFGAGVQHGLHIQSLLKHLGERTEFVSGETNATERDRIVQDFKAGRCRWLVNVRCFTTGFDAPNVDLVGLLYATESPGLYYQCVGRGFRLHPGKENCLVLDFGDNILTHGPVDMITATPARPGGRGTGAAPVKECPKCHSLIAPAFSICPDCGYVWPVKQPNHDKAAGSADPLSGGPSYDEEVEVDFVKYSAHEKKYAAPGHPRTLRVEYNFAGDRASQWVCVEHDPGYALDKAFLWWGKRCSLPMAGDADLCAEMGKAGCLARPLTVTLRHKSGQRWPEIIGSTVEEIPSKEEARARLDEYRGVVATVTPECVYDDDDDEVPF